MTTKERFEQYKKEFFGGDKDIKRIKEFAEKIKEKVALTQVPSPPSAEEIREMLGHRQRER
jgi:hypothetical protein